MGIQIQPRLQEVANRLSEPLGKEILQLEPLQLQLVPVHKRYACGVYSAAQLCSGELSQAEASSFGAAQEDPSRRSRWPEPIDDSSDALGKGGGAEEAGSDRLPA
jgi:hypothetical protein